MSSPSSSTQMAAMHTLTSTPASLRSNARGLWCPPCGSVVSPPQPLAQLLRGLTLKLPCLPFLESSQCSVSIVLPKELCEGCLPSGLSTWLTGRRYGQGLVTAVLAHTRRWSASASTANFQVVLVALHDPGRPISPVLGPPAPLSTPPSPRTHSLCSCSHHPPFLLHLLRPFSSPETPPQ